MVVVDVSVWRMGAPEPLNPLQMVSPLRERPHGVDDQLPMLILQLITGQVQILYPVVLPQARTEQPRAVGGRQVATRNLQSQHGPTFGDGCRQLGPGPGVDSLIINAQFC